MKRSILVVLGLAFGLTASSRAQEVAPRPQPPSPAAEPGAPAALNSMGTYLRTLQAFQVRAATTYGGRARRWREGPVCRGHGPPRTDAGPVAR